MKSLIKLLDWLQPHCIAQVSFELGIYLPQLGLYVHTTMLN